jgi:hypothetical protein
MPKGKKTTSDGGEVMKTTAKIPIELWREVKKVCIDQDIDLAEAINESLSLWMKRGRVSPPRS